MYCLPVAKREPHRLALRKAATSGSAKFFLGTDSAPHPAADKRPPAVAPASSMRPTPWKATPRPLTRKARWTAWKPLPPSTAPGSMACP
uniref:Dihydroorotase n=1 Tax=Phenylobacterium glaciei TaxID=2803784 RepID=A0A974P2B7_9CAUL|nr:hypothetical protein JKL49_18345 [Phenylobacterium glaciei]